MAQIKIFGYSDKISVKSGGKIKFHVNADGTQTANAVGLERLDNLDSVLIALRRDKKKK